MDRLDDFWFDRNINKDDELLKFDKMDNFDNELLNGDEIDKNDIKSYAKINRDDIDKESYKSDNETLDRLDDWFDGNINKDDELLKFNKMDNFDNELLNGDEIDKSYAKINRDDIDIKSNASLDGELNTKSKYFQAIPDLVWIDILNGENLNNCEDLYLEPDVDKYPLFPNDYVYFCFNMVLFI